jgi:ATP-dependent Clp protease ATP-binding subunit ClpC
LEAARKLKKKVKLFRTQSQRLTAGARYLGEWQELCDQLVAELVEAEGILWIEDLVRIFSVGGRSVEDSVGAYLAPRLKEGLRLVGEVTQAESQAIQRLMPSFFDSFEKLKIEPLSQERLQEVIGHVSEHFAINQRVQVEPAAQKLAIRLLDRFIRQEHFPGKAVQFLGDVVREQCSQEGRPPAKIQQIIQAFTRKTGMPAILVDDQLPLLPDSLLSWLEKKISGQPQALQSLVRVILAFKAGLNDPSRPVGVLLFAGPTGVGKTACARAIAEWAFGSEKALIRVDMSECQHPAALARLIGTPGGEPGELVRRVREKPFGVVLLDEVEKAHPAFFDTLLTVLDEGSLTDAFGRTTDFRGCLVILTTNLGAKRGGSLGFHEGVQGLDMGAITRFFRPEFLNRLDQVVPFSPLSLESVRTIAEQELALVAARPGFAGRNIQLLFSDAVVDRVVRAGFDPLLGARPLQRAVEQLVVASLAAWLLDHPGEGKVLVVDEKDGAIVVG